MIKNTFDNYGSVSKFLHWLIFVVIAAAIIAVLIGDEIPKDNAYRGLLYMIHKSCGISVLGLVILRLLWRFMNKVPKPVDGVNKIQVFSARIIHFGLYLTMFAMPISGLAFSKYPIDYFNIYQIPDFLMLGKEAKKAAHDFHHNVAWVIIGLIAVHIMAALYHHYVRKDRTLSRML